MKLYPCLFFAVLLSALSCRADVWTSVKGEKLRGTLVSYDFDAGTITIRRDYDGNVFDIPEMQLIHADRLKAVSLQNPGMSRYWYTSYRELRSKRANREKRLLFLYRNEGEPEAFELFCNKLLLRSEFQQFLKKNDFVVCIEETLPDEFRGWVESFHRTADAKNAQPERGPFAFYKSNKEPPVGYSAAMSSASLLIEGGNPFERKSSDDTPKYRSTKQIEDMLADMSTFKKVER